MVVDTFGTPIDYPPVRREHEITRLEAFSDAVFGFTLTLLVVALEVPRSYGELTAMMGGFLSFACCFTLLVWIWHEHNRFFRRYGLQDGYTVVLNGGNNNRVRGPRLLLLQAIATSARRCCEK